MDSAYLERARGRLSAKTERTDGCWVWQGTRDGLRRYGMIYFDGKPTGAHRVAWILDNGPIPLDGVIAHHCDNPPCVRPDHLFLTDRDGNMADMRAKLRHPHGTDLSVAIRQGWTAEKRERRSNLMTTRHAARREAAAVAAGVPPDWKFCPCCEHWQPRTSFHRNAARDDGLKAHCKPCATAKDLARRAKRYEGSRNS